MCNVSSHIKGHQAIRFVVGAMPILFGLYACAAPSNPVVNAVEPDYAHIGAKEVELLTGSGGRARRMGYDDVILTFDNGGTKTLHNDNKGCQDGPGHCDGLHTGRRPAEFPLVLSV